MSDAQVQRLATHPYEKAQKSEYQCESDHETKIILASGIVNLIHTDTRIEE